uniref:Plectin/eS10 N-terminal domain-containing protein n=1 Tax=Poecilia latipinna TaxID=48699 RepID=A0A3B3UAR4_9TELE
MLMPMHELKAIYEVLFRDGVMVAKKDKRPQIKHPEVRDVTNLQVIRAMGSLKSRGYVRETFAWRHFYWYLTNDGIVYLRDYLHLPAEIIPASLQRVRKPAATLAFARPAGAACQNLRRREGDKAAERKQTGISPVLLIPFHPDLPFLHLCPPLLPPPLLCLLDEDHTW